MLGNSLAAFREDDFHREFVDDHVIEDMIQKAHLQDIFVSCEEKKEVNKLFKKPVNVKLVRHRVLQHHDCEELITH